MKSCLLSLALLLIVAGSALGQTNRDDIDLSAAQIRDYAAEAVDGDPSSAVRLAIYFEFKKNDLNAAEQWYLIAAENGDASAMHDLWRFREDSDDPSTKRRAMFWLKKSAALGDKASIHELDHLKVEKPKQRHEKGL